MIIELSLKMFLTLIQKSEEKKNMARRFFELMYSLTF